MQMKRERLPPLHWQPTACCLQLEPEHHHEPCHQRQRPIEIPIQNDWATLRKKLLLNCEFTHVNKFTKLWTLEVYCLYGNVENNKMHNAGAVFKIREEWRESLEQFCVALQEGKNARELNGLLDSRIKRHRLICVEQIATIFLCVSIHTCNVGMLIIYLMGYEGWMRSCM